MSKSLNDFNRCFPDPPGYRETINAIKEAKARQEQKSAAPVKKEKKKGKSQPRPKEPEGTSKFSKDSLVDLWWGSVWGWRGPYVVKSGLRYGHTLVKVSNPLTGSTTFVSEKRLRRNQIKKFQ